MANVRSRKSSKNRPKKKISEPPISPIQKMPMPILFRAIVHNQRHPENALHVHRKSLSTIFFSSNQSLTCFFRSRLAAKSDLRSATRTHFQVATLSRRHTLLRTPSACMRMVSVVIITRRLVRSSVRPCNRSFIAAVSPLFPPRIPNASSNLLRKHSLLILATY